MMMHIKLLAGCFTVVLLLSGCGGSDGGNDDTKDEKKTFTLSLSSVEVAKTADGIAVTLEPSSISSSGTVTIQSKN